MPRSARSQKLGTAGAAEGSGPEGEGTEEASWERNPASVSSNQKLGTAVGGEGKGVGASGGERGEGERVIDDSQKVRMAGG